MECASAPDYRYKLVGIEAFLADAGKGSLMTDDTAITYRTTGIGSRRIPEGGTRTPAIVATEPDGHLMSFTFEGTASADADAYFLGSSVPARELFEAHRHLRALIQQLKQHLNQQNGSERKYDYKKR